MRPGFRPTYPIHSKSAHTPNTLTRNTIHFQNNHVKDIDSKNDFVIEKELQISSQESILKTLNMNVLESSRFSNILIKNGDLIVYGNSILTNVNVENDFLLNKNATIYGDMEVQNISKFLKDVTVSNNLFVSNNIYTNSISVSNNAVFHSDMFIKETLKGNVIHTNELNVSGNSVFSSNVNILGDLKTQNMKIEKTFSVHGNVIFGANVLINQLNTENLIVKKNFISSAVSVFKGGVDIYSSLTVSQNTNIQGFLLAHHGATFMKNVLVHNKLDVQGDASVNNLRANLVQVKELNVEGNVDAKDITSDNLKIYKQGIIQNLHVLKDLEVSGDTRLYGNTIIEGTLKAENGKVTSGLIVDGDCHLKNGLYIGGSKISITADVNIEGNLYFSGNTLEIHGDSILQNVIAKNQLVESTSVISDIRKFTEINKVTNILETIDSINTYLYKFNDKEYIGFIGQEANEIFYNIVDTEQTFNLNYNSMLALLWQITKELYYKVKILENT